jgi:hypothetical protein
MSMRLGLGTRALAAITAVVVGTALGCSESGVGLFESRSAAGAGTGGSAAGDGGLPMGGGGAGSTAGAGGEPTAGQAGQGSAGEPGAWQPVRRTLASGGGRCCWIDDGRVMCTDGSVLGLENIVDVAVSDASGDLPGHGFFGCAVDRDGALFCWGQDHLGDDLEHSPARVPNIDQVVQVTAGYSHACVLRRDESVWCWGNYSSRNIMLSDVRVPTHVAGLPPARHVGRGWKGTCAALADGTVSCWDSAEFPNSVSIPDTSVPTTVPGLTGVTDVVLTGYNNPAGFLACAHRSDDTAFCWGTGLTQSGGPSPLEVTGVSQLAVRHDINLFVHESVVGLTPSGDVVCLGGTCATASSDVGPGFVYQTGALEIAYSCERKQDGIWSGSTLIASF